jgi:acyl dehydratase
MSDLPAEVQSWIGTVRYEDETTFEIERGYIFTSNASVENGNPLFWDDEVAREVTGGPIAPPTTLSVWFRPHHWRPGKHQLRMPYQIHFDLKAALDLPEAIMTDNEFVFGVPVRPGDKLYSKQSLASVSPLKKTKLGTGRFWAIEVEYSNQRGERVAWESITGYGYKRNV